MDIETVTKTGISALGLLVGFSWERCFDRGVEMLAAMMEREGVGELENERHKALCRLIGAVIVTIVIVPAWSWYIVSKVLAHKRWHHAVSSSNFSGANIPSKPSKINME